MRRRSTSASARTVLHEHEETIRQVLGDRDYQLLVRYLSGSVRLLQKLEHTTEPLPTGRRQLKMSPALNDDTKRALEAIADHLAGVFQYDPPKRTGAAARRQLKVVKGGTR